MPELSEQLLARLQLLNPPITPDHARRAFTLLYAKDQEWRPFCYAFSVPSVVMDKLAKCARDGDDISPHIAHWLDQIGIPD